LLRGVISEKEFALRKQVKVPENVAQFRYL